MKNINPTTTNAWKALQQHHKTQSAVTIQQLFAQEKIVLRIIPCLLTMKC